MLTRENSWDAKFYKYRGVRTNGRSFNCLFGVTAFGYIPFDPSIFKLGLKARAVSANERLRSLRDLLAWHSFWVTKGRRQLPCSWICVIDTGALPERMRRAYDSHLLATRVATRVSRRESCAQARHQCQRHKFNKEVAAFLWSLNRNVKSKRNLIQMTKVRSLSLAETGLSNFKLSFKIDRSNGEWRLILYRLIDFPNGQNVPEILLTL